MWRDSACGWQVHTAMEVYTAGAVHIMGQEAEGEAGIRGRCSPESFPLAGPYFLRFHNLPE